jgi:hypothetical protein
MILHPGIMALLAGGGIVLLMLAYAGGLGVKILWRWDFQSSSAGQLLLERQTTLVSTLVQYALGFEIVALFLFIYTVEDLHPLFPGAMCATGSLNAAPAGWAALGVKVAAFFAAALWMALNHLDQQAPDYPLVRLKYALLLGLVPLAAADLYLQLHYFLGLDPGVITSCCGSLFSEGGSGVAAGLAGLPIRPAMFAFYGTITLCAVLAGLCLWRRSPLLRALLAVAAAALAGVGIAGIVSFVSLYYYELPTHHCPFDLLQGACHFIGYPLYASLAGAVLGGLVPGLLAPLRRIPTLAGPLRRIERRWLLTGLLCLLVFAVLASWPIVFGDFTMAGYW